MDFDSQDQKDTNIMDLYGFRGGRGLSKPDDEVAESIYSK